MNPAISRCCSYGVALALLPAPGAPVCVLTVLEWTRVRAWVAEGGTMDGIWQKILEEANRHDDAVGEMQRVVSVDSTVIRPHQQSAVDREFLGRSRGELTRQDMRKHRVSLIGVVMLRGGVSPDSSGFGI